MLYGNHIEDYLTEEEYEEIFKDKVAILNSYGLLEDGYEFSLDYAYDGVRLTKKRKSSGGESDMSYRFFYDDEENYSDYEAFKCMLDAMINVLREIKKCMASKLRKNN